MGVMSEDEIEFMEEDGVEWEGSCDVEEATDKVGMGVFHWKVYIIVGLFTAADSVEIGFISFVTEILAKDPRFALTDGQKALMESMIFLGMFLGAPTWGYLADKFGRQKVMVISAFWVSVFGFATALAPSTAVLIPLRFMVGFGAAGCVVAFDIFAESLPSDWRAPLTMSTFYWFTAGSLYSTFAAKYTLCDYGWEVYTAVCALPTLVAAIAGYFLVPESTHWLVAEDRNKEAAVVLNNIARQNGADVRFRRLTQPEVLEEISDMDLFKRSKLRKPLMWMMLCWLGWGLAYYGISLLLPHLFSNDEEGDDARRLEALVAPLTKPLTHAYLDYLPGVSRVVLLDTNGTKPEKCEAMKENCWCLNFDFAAILTSNAGQALGLTLGVLIVDRIGRVKTQQIMYFFGAVFALGLGFPDQPHHILSIYSTVSLAMVNGASSCTWSHTPELFPTHARVLAMGLCSAATRVGAFSAPFVISKYIDDLPTAIIMASFSALAGIAVSFVKETAGARIESEDVESSDVSEWSESE